ncbi:MAG: TonB-dependent receptor [Pyrinomonadaceae bacterium]
MIKTLRKPIFCCLSLIICFLILGGIANAQKNVGSIIGTVKDPNDALVPNAKIVVTNNATNISRETTSDDSGNFTVTNLEPGNYKVTVEASGFKTLVLSSVTVETNARVALNTVFTELSNVEGEVVNVETDSAPLVESETSVRGDIITGREVVDLPIPQRNFTLLAGLSPGVTRPSGGSVGVLGGSNRVDPGAGNPSTESTRFRESGGSVISANGARVTQNNFSLDGVDNNESQFGQIAIYPNPDAIAEFKIETSVPSAESGRAAGAIISTTFKSGGNDIHGTVFENYQGRFLSAAASQFDENGTNSGNSPNYVTHNYGGTVGGPIWFPRPGINGKDPFWYDGRNRTFFFVSFAGQRNGTPAFGGGEFPFVTVPTARQRAGDFGEMLVTLPNAGGCGNPDNAAFCQTFNLAGGGTVMAPIGTIFDPLGNPIPGNNLANCPICGAFSTFGSSLLNAYPLPTQPGLQNNYRRNRAEKSNVDSFDVKIDHKISDKNSIFGRYSWSKNSRIRDNNFPLGTSPNGNDLPSGFGAGDEFGNSRGITLGDTHIFTPTIVNDMRAGWTKVEIGINNPGINGALGFNPGVTQSLGGNNINVCGTCDGIILLGIVDRNDLSQEFVGDGGPFFFLSNNYNFADTVTIVKGNSIFKFGTDLRNRRNTNFDGGRNGGIKGQYQYGTSAGGFVAGNYDGIGPNDTGSAIANMLLGYQPGFVGRGTPGGPFTSQNAEMAFFVQNDWKVNSDLTLNLGLRYDIFTAPTERFDRQSNFNLATGNIDVAGDNAPGGRDLASNDLNNIGPRIGFAYSGLLDSKRMVLRGGYGIVYTTDVSGVQPLTANPGTGAANFSCNPITNPGNCPAGYPLGRNPFEAGIPFAPGSDVIAQRGTSFPAPTGSTIIYNDPDRRDAYVHQYNLTLQYEFWKNWLGEIAYVGSSTRNLLIVRNIGTQNNQGGPGSRQVTNIGTVVASEYTGSARYDAFQSKLEKRFTRGLSILATYTFSKAIDDTPGGFCFGGTGPATCGPDDPLRPDLDRGLSDLDIPHRFTFASVWDLPFGKGRQFLGDIPTALDAVIGGWQLNNIVTIQSGPRFTPNWRGGRPDIIGDPTASAAQRAQGILFNAAAFTAPTTQVFAADTGCFTAGVANGNCPMIGTLGRNTLQGERQEYWDASLFKNFPIRAISEAFNVQVRISAYNVLNHVNRGTPVSNIEDANFGRDFSEQRRRQMEFGLKIIF